MQEFKEFLGSLRSSTKPAIVLRMDKTNWVQYSTILHAWGLGGGCDRKVFYH